VLFLDFETRSAVDLKTAGADVYARDPSTDILCVGWAIDDDPADVLRFHTKQQQWMGWMERVIAGEKVVAHNASFELLIWNHVATKKYNWPPLKPEQTICTMATAYAMALPGSLEKASAATGIAQQKDLAGQRVMRSLSSPKEDGTFWQPSEDPEKFAKLYEYCKQDVEVERELYKRLMPLSKQENKVWLIDHTINQRGIAIDVEAAKAAIEMVELEKKRLDQEMRTVTSNQVASCSAVVQLTTWLKEQGVDCKGVAKAEVTSLLASSSDLPPACVTALKLRQEAAKSSTAKLETMLNSVCSDGRIRGIFQYHGAGTGRWAGRRIQPHNFPRPSLKQEEIEQVFGLLRGVS
jgi:DNA polymerase